MSVRYWGSLLTGGVSRVKLYVADYIRDNLLIAPSGVSNPPVCKSLKVPAVPTHERD